VGISPDGRYWWDGTRWVPLLASPAGAAAKPVSTAPRGMRGLLIGSLLVSDLFTAPLALVGLLAIADDKGMLGRPPPPPNPDAAAGWVVVIAFELLFLVTIAASVAVLTRLSWARAASYVAATALALTCLGLLLAIPIFYAASRASLREPPSPYQLPGSSSA
jgi:hypothetical protein